MCLWGGGWESPNGVFKELRRKRGRAWKARIPKKALFAEAKRSRTLLKLLPTLSYFA